MTTHSYLAPKLKKEYSHTYTPPLWECVACSMVNLTFIMVTTFCTFPKTRLCSSYLTNYTARHVHVTRNAILKCVKMMWPQRQNAHNRFHKNRITGSRSQTHEQTRPTANHLCCTIRKEPPLRLPLRHHEIFRVYPRDCHSHVYTCWLLTAPRVPQDRRSRPAVCLLHKTVE